MTDHKYIYVFNISVCVIVSDGTTENNSLFDGLSTFSTDNMLPSDLKSKFKDVNFEYKCVRKHPMSHDLIFLIADMPHLVKKIVNALEMSSLKKSKRNIFVRLSTIVFYFLVHYAYKSKVYVHINNILRLLILPIYFYVLRASKNFVCWNVEHE